MKKLIILFISLMILASCSQSSGKNNNELGKSIMSAMDKNDAKEMDLTDVTDFSWDKAYIFNPYTSQKSINEQLGVKFKDPSGIDSRDDIYLIVFLKQNKVIHYAEIERKYGDLSSDKENGITPSDATVKITKQ
ncbi:MAG: hypothetical protein ABF649_17750 [Bacillus sp. (in: firmicutes)]